jgi:hypothetical protein
MIELHAVDLEIESSEVEDASGVVKVAKVRPTPERETLSFVLERPLARPPERPEGEGRLRGGAHSRWPYPYNALGEGRPTKSTRLAAGVKEEAEW